MAQVGEWLTRLGLLWLDGVIVIGVAMIQAGPFILAGGGVVVLTWFLTERDQRRDEQEGRRHGDAMTNAEPQQPFTVR